MRLQTWRGSKFLSWLWLITIAVLCFLPGSAFPKENWLDGIAFDKWVHLGLFAVLTFLWRFQFSAERKYDYIVVMLAIAYGFGVEVIQHYFIPNRSFDVGDVIADAIGGAIGVLVWVRVYKKNRPL